MFYKNEKVKVQAPDGDTDFLDIFTGILQGDSLAPYLFIICRDYVFGTSINQMKKWLYTKKGKKPKIPHINYCGCRLRR